MASIYAKLQIKKYFDDLIDEGLSESEAIEQTASYFIASVEAVMEIVGIEANEME